MLACPLVLPLVQVCDFNLSEILSEAVEEKSGATNPLWLVSCHCSWLPRGGCLPCLLSTWGMHC